MIEFNIALRDMEAFLDEADFCISYESKEPRATWATWEIIANTTVGDITIIYHDKESSEYCGGQLSLTHMVPFDGSEKLDIEIMRWWAAQGKVSALFISKRGALSEKGFLPDAIFRRIIMPSYGISKLLLEKEFECFLREISGFEDFKKRIERIGRLVYE